MKNWITVHEIRGDGSERNDLVKHLNVKYIIRVEHYPWSDRNYSRVFYGYGSEIIVRGSCQDILDKIEEAQRQK